MDAQKRKILLMYITKVSGHRQATLAIQNSLRQLNHDIEAPRINGFGYTFPRLEKVVNRAYLSVIKRTPKVWDFLYDNPKVVKKSASIKRYLHRTSYPKLEQLFDRYRPDTVVCTQAFPCGMVADYKLSRGLDIRLIGVLTDFAPHSFWLNEGVDYYVVPNAEARDRFIAKGIAEDKIKVYGIPIRLRFAAQLDKDSIIQRLGMKADIPIILVMGGGQGLGPIRQVVKSLLRINMELQLIVITGINKKLTRGLQKMNLPPGKTVRYYEYVHNVDELMEIAALIITKPGGMTTSESLAKGLPMVIVNPIPGQEMRNTDFLMKNGIAIRIDNTGDIGEEIELLLRSPERLGAMREAAYVHARPHAASDIAKLILNGVG